MITVQQIMSTDVVALSPGMSLREAAERLAEAGITGAPVTAGGEVVGVVSATDLVEFDAETPGVPTERDFGPTTLEGLEGDAEPWEEGDEPSASYFSQLWDDAGADIVARISNPDSPEWNVLEDHTVEEIMTRKVSSIEPTAHVRELARRLLEEGVHRMLVMEEGRLVGVVTTTDLVKAVAQWGIAG